MWLKVKEFQVKIALVNAVILLFIYQVLAICINSYIK